MVAHNEAVAKPAVRTPPAFVTRDDAGTILGGLWGASSYRWLFVEYLALPVEGRGKGIGRALIIAAGGAARRRGCVGVWLETYSFQRRGFYERLGYASFGRIVHYPPGETRFIMSKRIKSD